MKTYTELADELSRGITYKDGPERAVQEHIVNQRLLAPFPKSETEVRPGATKGGKAQPLFYVDPRAYDKRLTQVFGLGGYSIKTPLVHLALEDTERSSWQAKANGDGNEKISKRITGLLAAVVVEIDIHTPYMSKTVSNVGEKGLDASSDFKVTSAQAQAFKRAATQLGVGAYLYHISMGFVAYDKTSGFGFTVPPDKDMEQALRNAGFRFTCEITGGTVTWGEASRSMHFYGRVMCDAELRKLLDMEKTAKEAAVKL